MNIPTNYQLLKLESARRYLLKIVTSLQEVEDVHDDSLIFEFMNLVAHLENRIAQLKQE